MVVFQHKADRTLETMGQYMTWILRKKLKIKKV